MMQNQTELSIIIPTRNDERLIGDVLDRAREAAGGLGCSFEIVVVDAGSTDRTAQIAEDRGAKVCRLVGLSSAQTENRGAIQNRSGRP